MEGSTEQIASPVGDSKSQKADGGSSEATNKGSAVEASQAAEKTEPTSVDATSSNGNGAPGNGDSGKSLKAPLKSDLEPREPVDITLKTLLQAGVHFGHQTSRWSPAMSEFIYGSRNGIHIVNLPKTISSWEQARQAIVEVAARGGSVLFVGTKKQAQDSIIEEARRCGAFYVARRWLGGMITNFQTIRKSIARLNKLEEILAEEEASLEKGEGSKFTKKERLMMSRDRDKLEFSLGGIRDMYGAPQLMFVVDIKREDIAIKEAQRLDIPVVALVDTNCNPNQVTFPVPSNDDGTRAIRLFASAVCDAILEGKKKYQASAPVQDKNKVKSATTKSNAGPRKSSAKKKPSKTESQTEVVKKKPAAKASAVAKTEEAPKASVEEKSAGESAVKVEAAEVEKAGEGS